MTQTGWWQKQTEIQEDFTRGIGSEALYQPEYETEPDKIATTDLIRLSTNIFAEK